MQRRVDANVVVSAAAVRCAPGPLRQLVPHVGAQRRRALDDAPCAPPDRASRSRRNCVRGSRRLPERPDASDLLARPPRARALVERCRRPGTARHSCLRVALRLSAWSSCASRLRVTSVSCLAVSSASRRWSSGVSTLPVTAAVVCTTSRPTSRLQLGQHPRVFLLGRVARLDA